MHAFGLVAVWALLQLVAVEQPPSRKYARMHPFASKCLYDAHQYCILHDLIVSCRRAQGGAGGNPMGPMGGPMEFGRSKSKFQEVPETGVTFVDVAVSAQLCCWLVPV